MKIWRLTLDNKFDYDDDADDFNDNNSDFILNHKKKQENFRIPLCEKKENFFNSPFRKIKNCESQIAEKIKNVHTVDYEWKLVI